jgi:hypothetical protein
VSYAMTTDPKVGECLIRFFCLSSKARRGERLGLPDELLIGSIDLEWD